MSIKTSADEWVRKGPTQAMAVVAAAGLVIGALVGLGLGYKIEQSRTKSDVKKLQAKIKANSTSTGSAKSALGQRVGTVTDSSNGIITLSTKKRGSQKLATTDTTVFESVVGGTIADVDSGRRVLVTPGGNEILVLSTDSRLGRIVNSVGSDSIGVAEGNGSPAAKIKTSDVHRVETVKTATATDIAKGDKVLAGGNAKSDSDFNAIEVIVLPDDTGFVG
jgi:hypothetical protein